jgi:hypothetical protein
MRQILSPRASVLDFRREEYSADMLGGFNYLLNKVFSIVAPVRCSKMKGVDAS